jgi:peptidoglycan hydrolase CwlO-like protein
MLLFGFVFFLASLLHPVGLHGESPKDNLTMQIETLENLLLQITDLQMNIEALKSQRESLQNEINGSKTVIADQTKSLETLQAQLTAYQKEVASLQERFAKLLLRSQELETLSLVLGISAGVGVVGFIIALIAK